MVKVFAERNVQFGPRKRQRYEITSVLPSLAVWLALILGALACQRTPHKTTTSTGKPLTELALLDAAREGDVKAVEEILNSGISPEVQPTGTETPLISAARHGKTEVVKLLIKRGAFLENRDGFGMTALGYAARRGHLDIVKILVGAGSYFDTPDLKYKLTPLMLASYEGREEVVRFLLDAGANPNLLNNDRGTALMNAAFSGNATVVGLLLAKGVNVNIQTSNGFTALMFATEQKATAAVKLLLDAGADISLHNSEGKTALDIARAGQWEQGIALLSTR
jgi:ankyrin repeat protein